MKTIHIKLENGYWLVNDKVYTEMNLDEKHFFEGFLVAMRINFRISQLFD